ncbi:unnamed protein product [Menidia menidia]|uniref:(Atlantic silverside) hypothetical protein n=1 Tax=Menidia menidia TaxID=238744 RepID=A0A8S4BGV3_9TELE|nr:unnamed protein product [Menidia menidia]CAG5943379.1 unnamed protein product [Menidia menidia]
MAIKILITQFDCVSEEQFITDEVIVEAREATEEDLLVVHSKRYLNKLKVTLVLLSVFAGKLAVDRGWAINVGKYICS